MSDDRAKLCEEILAAADRRALVRAAEDAVEKVAGATLIVPERDEDPSETDLLNAIFLLMDRDADLHVKRTAEGRWEAMTYCGERYLWGEHADTRWDALYSLRWKLADRWQVPAEAEAAQ